MKVPQSYQQAVGQVEAIQEALEELEREQIALENKEDKLQADLDIASRWMNYFEKKEGISIKSAVVSVSKESTQKYTKTKEKQGKKGPSIKSQVIDYLRSNSLSRAEIHERLSKANPETYNKRSTDTTLAVLVRNKILRLENGKFISLHLVLSGKAGS